MVEVGIDEAGRGALAGPVAVGAACIPPGFDWSSIPNVRDSKQLSPKAREEVFERVRTLQKEGMLDFKVAMVSAKVIDRIGISRAVSLAIRRILIRLPHAPEELSIRLDGLLKAPAVYHDQETITKGDQLVPAISLASICAKVTRDRYMVRVTKQYPDYGFEVHKGYGTVLHRSKLRTYGLCPLHRRYFIHID